MAESKFGLPQSSYPELLKMVQAYFLADRRSKGEPVKVPDVAAGAGIDPSTLSRNNAFFSSVDLISGGQRKTLSDLGRRLGLAVDHGDDKLRMEALGELIDGSDFLGRVVSAVRVRSGMDLSSLQSHIAISSGSAKSTRVMTGAAAVANLLIDSGRLVDEGGTLRATTRASATRSVPSVGPTDESVARDTTVTTTTTAPSIYSSALYGSGGVYGYNLAWPAVASSGGTAININITVQLDGPDDLLALLRQLGVLSEPEETAAE